MLGAARAARVPLTGKGYLPFRGIRHSRSYGRQRAAAPQRLHVDDAALQCDRDGMRAVLRPQFRQDAFHVRFYRLLTH
jgi:hypothetical protein